MQTIPKTDRVILSVRGVSVIDPDAALSLLEVAENYKAQGVELLIYGLNHGVRAVLDRAGVTEAIGEDKFYWSVDRALIHKQNA
ncbi:MAG: sodium-independent anion transporter [Clostridia bacterium]|nr:sodium-independent anion transporter [Clostridia bacterium]